MKTLVRNVYYVKDSSDYYWVSSCDPTDYEPLYLQMGDHYFGIPPEEYLYTFPDFGWCLIGIQ